MQWTEKDNVFKIGATFVPKHLLTQQLFWTKFSIHVPRNHYWKTSIKIGNRERGKLRLSLLYHIFDVIILISLLFFPKWTLHHRAHCRARPLRAFVFAKTVLASSSVLWIITRVEVEPTSTGASGGSSGDEVLVESMPPRARGEDRIWKWR